MEGNFFFFFFLFKSCFKTPPCPLVHVKVQLSRKYQGINPKKQTATHTHLHSHFFPVVNIDVTSQSCVCTGYNLPAPDKGELAQLLENLRRLTNPDSAQIPATKSP